MLVCVQEGQVIECSQVSDIREGVSPKVSAIHGCKNVFLRFQFFSKNGSNVKNFCQGFCKVFQGLISN